MKIILFLSILFFFQTTFGEKRELSSIYYSIQENDWIDYETTNFFKPGDISCEYPDEWREEDNTLKATFRACVTKKTKTSIEFNIELKHLYLIQYSKRHDYINYFDSYYSDIPLPKFPIKFKYEVLSGGEAVDFTWVDSTLRFNSLLISPGIKNDGYHHATTPWQNIKIDKSLIVQELGKALENNHPSTSHVLDASFTLPPNNLIVYFPSKPIPTDEDVILTLDNRKIKLQSTDGKSYQAAFHLGVPQKALLDETMELLHLSPNDTIKITQTGDSLVFSGKSAKAHQYWQEIRKNTGFFTECSSQINWEDDPEATLKKIQAEKNIYETILKKYETDLHPYWKKSANLSLKYWEITYRINAYLYYSHTKEHASSSQIYNIDWMRPPFNEVNLFIDHLYQPQAYDDFLEGYFRNKTQELNKDNITNKFYSFNALHYTPTTYYLQKDFFSGYPQMLRLYKNLESSIERFHLSRLQGEYKDFCEICRNPDLLKKIKQKWEQYQELEPGNSIRTLYLNIADSLPLKKKADGYIVLEIANHFNSPGIQRTDKRIREILEELNLKEQTKLCFFYPESFKSSMSSLDQPEYHFIRDSLLFDDLKRLNRSSSTLIVLKNDGTIVSRELQRQEENIGTLKNILEEDLYKPKAPKTFNRSEVLGILAIFLIIGGIVGLVVIIRFRRIRLSRRFTELELKAIRSQMNPHFIFNALGSIQSLIVQGKNDRANHYLTDFAKLLRNVLSSSEKTLVSLSDEITQLRLYLSLEQLRTPFDFNITIDTSVDDENEEVPGMLLQPIVENAVIHGIVPQGGGEINIHFHQKESMLYCEITDTGKGPGSTGAIPGKPHRFGIRATEERLRLLNKQNHAQIGIIIKDRQEEENTNGCRVIISIPL